MKRIFCFLLMLCMLVNINSVCVYAEYDKNNTSVTYGGKTLPIGNYKNGEKFKNSVDGATQCLGFAFYVQDTLFGFHYKNSGNKNGDKFNVKKDIKFSNVTELKKVFEDVVFGAHIRTNLSVSPNKKGQYTSHSMIFMKSNDSYIWTYEGNADGNYGVYVIKKTWEQMYSYLTYTKKGINYIASPKVQNFHVCPKSGRNDQGEYGYETYKNGKITEYGACKQCHKPYDWQSTLKKTGDMIYEIKNGSKNEKIKVRNAPYDGATVLSDKVNKTFNVIGSVTNAYGNKWYAIDYQDDVKKQCYTAYVYSGQIDEHYNLRSASNNVILKQYNSGNTITSNQTNNNTQVEKPSAPIKFELESIPKGELPYGKDFTLKGWFRSDAAIVETRAYILDENKNVVMQSDKASSTTNNYKIQGYKLDKGIKFDELNPGGYYLKYYVKDADGDSNTWVSDKFYIVKVDTPPTVSEVEKPSAPIKFEIESVPKGNLPYGKDFTLKGWFRSDAAIVETRAYILDENKNVVMQSDKASSTTSNYKIEGYKLDKGIKFDELNPGGYYLKYYVKDADGDTGTWMSDKFYIVKENTNASNNNSSSNNSNSSQPSKPATSSTSIRFEIESMPKGNLPYGKSFSLKGWFRSDSAIVEARAYMLDANKNIVMQSDPASSTTSNYKIQGYKLDKAMKFDKLSPGGYYLKFFVRDANGDTFTWTSDKFYIVK